MAVSWPLGPQCDLHIIYSDIPTLTPPFQKPFQRQDGIVSRIPCVVRTNIMPDFLIKINYIFRPASLLSLSYTLFIVYLLVIAYRQTFFFVLRSLFIFHLFNTFSFYIFPMYIFYTFLYSLHTQGFTIPYR